MYDRYRVDEKCGYGLSNSALKQHFFGVPCTYQRKILAHLVKLGCVKHSPCYHRYLIYATWYLKSTIALVYHTKRDVFKTTAAKARKDKGYNTYSKPQLIVRETLALAKLKLLFNVSNILK